MKFWLYIWTRDDHPPTVALRHAEGLDKTQSKEVLRTLALIGERRRVVDQGGMWVVTLPGKTIGVPDSAVSRVEVYLEEEHPTRTA